MLAEVQQPSSLMADRYNYSHSQYVEDRLEQLEERIEKRWEKEDTASRELTEKVNKILIQIEGGRVGGLFLKWAFGLGAAILSVWSYFHVKP